MNSFDKLIRYFEHFPGIGSRQARRFAFHLLTLNKGDVAELSELIKEIRTNVVECPSCFRFHSMHHGEQHCTVCLDTTRDRSKLTVVERDSDVDAISRGGVYNGLYFVLGGMVPLLDTKDIKNLRGGALKHIVETRVKEGLTEIILGFSVNPDGENTGRYIEVLLKDIIKVHALKISYLGRGLSTGSELEYADSETIKNAFKNRS